MTRKPGALLPGLLCASLSCFGAFGQTCSQCVPTWIVGTPTLFNGCNQAQGETTLTKAQPYTVSWPDGTSGTKTNAGGGECLGNEDCNYLDTVNCWAYFNGPVASAGSWQETEAAGVAEFISGVHGCPNNGLQGENLACTAGATFTLTWNYTCNCPVCTNGQYFNSSTDSCVACTGSPAFECSGDGSPVCTATGWGCPSGDEECVPPPNITDCTSPSYVSCTGSGWACITPAGTPIIVDTQNQGFHLTDWAHGVQFAFYPSQPIPLSWTDAAYANGWLALDRNGNGLIDNATELFGNITPQPPSATPNGFLALAVFDEPANGGNGNGVIDPGDAVYPHLLVWIDANHDGVSQPGELKTLQEVGIFRIDLKYTLSPFVDQYGNRFRYHGMDWDAAGDSHQATYDVFLTTSPIQK
jgi:hypothetical protein